MQDDAIRPATASDWSAIECLLQSSNLPLNGARDHLADFVVVERDRAVIGCGAIERHGRHALLRSVAIDPTRRGHGLGDRIVRHLIEKAAAARFHSLVLLTTTARDWFPRFGFRETMRERVAPELMESAEFRGACPDTAVVMSLEIHT